MSYLPLNPRVQVYKWNIFYNGYSSVLMFVLYLCMAILYSNTIIIQHIFSLADDCYQIHNWHAITKGSSVNKPSSLILDIQHVEAIKFDRK